MEPKCRVHEMAEGVWQGPRSCPKDPEEPRRHEADATTTWRKETKAWGKTVGPIPLSMPQPRKRQKHTIAWATSRWLTQQLSSFFFSLYLMLFCVGGYINKIYKEHTARASTHVYSLYSKRKSKNKTKKTNTCFTRFRDAAMITMTYQP